MVGILSFGKCFSPLGWLPLITTITVSFFFASCDCMIPYFLYFLSVRGFDNRYPDVFAGVRKVNAHRFVPTFNNSHRPVCHWSFWPARSKQLVRPSLDKCGTLSLTPRVKNCPQTGLWMTSRRVSPSCAITANTCLFHQRPRPSSDHRTNKAWLWIVLQRRLHLISMEDTVCDFLFDNSAIAATTIISKAHCE